MSRIVTSVAVSMPVTVNSSAFVFVSNTRIVIDASGAITHTHFIGKNAASTHG